MTIGKLRGSHGGGALLALQAVDRNPSGRSREPQAAPLRRLLLSAIAA